MYWIICGVTDRPNVPVTATVMYLACAKLKITLGPRDVREFGVFPALETHIGEGEELLTNTEYTLFDWST